MLRKLLWIVPVISFTLGCGLTEDLKNIKKVNDELEQEVGGDPNVNYTSGTGGKVVKVKFFGELKDSKTAAAKTKEIVDKHLKEVDKLELWKCKKQGSMETCTGM